MEKQEALIINPYTYITLVGGNYLLYNTINGEYIRGNNLNISKILKRLLFTNSQWMYHVPTEDKDTDLSNFILEIKEKNIGDYIKNDNKQGAIQFYPIKNIQHDIKRYKGYSEYKSGDNVAKYIHELSIYINSQCTQKCQSCGQNYKQYTFCRKEKDNINIDLKALSSFIGRTALPSLYRINILGGNIWNYPQLEKLQQELSTLNVDIYYHTYISNFNLKQIDLNSFKHIVVLVNIAEYKETYNEAFHAIENIEYNFFITNETELNMVHSLIKKHQLIHYQIRPVYNKRNYEFFKEFVFINEEDIFERTHTFQDIFRNDTLNCNYFGKMTVFANGDVFADVNKKAIGDIYHNSISELIWKELETGQSWFKTRKRQKPCNKCIFREFCPPTSNIEVALRKNDLCYKLME